MSTHWFGAAPRALFSLTVAHILTFELGCSSSTALAPGEVGEIELAIKQVPEDVLCVRIDAVGARSLTQSFDVTPGEDTRLVMSRLPLGEVEFRGFAYDESCNDLTPTTEAAWFSDPVRVTIARGERAKVTLLMRRTGTAEVTVDFETEGMGECIVELVDVAMEGPQEPIALNDLGQVVVRVEPPSGDTATFIWQKGHPLVELGANIYVWDINERGQVAARVDDTATIFDGATARSLGTLGGRYSSPYAINDAGTVVGDSDTAVGTTHAFIWRSETGMTDLGTLGGSYSMALSINEDGVVIGQSTNANELIHGFEWREGVMRDLGTLGGSWSSAVAINASGTIVGYSALAGDEVYHAFVWKDGTMQDLGTLGGTVSQAVAINALGQVIGIGNNANGDPSTFLWEDGVMRDLEAILSSENPLIDDSGRVVVDRGNESGDIFVWQAGTGRIIDIPGLPFPQPLALTSKGKLLLRDVPDGDDRVRTLVYDLDLCSPRP